MAESKPILDSKQRLAELLKQSFVPQVLLLTSLDELRRLRTLNSLKTKFFNDQTIKAHKIDATTWSKETKSELINLLNSPGLFQSVTLIQIDNVAALSKTEQVDQLVDCLQYASEQTSLWLTSTPLAKANKLRKACEKRGCLIEIPTLTGTPLKTWIKKEAVQRGLNALNDQLIDSIKHVANESPDQIAPILEHLAQYSNDGSLSYAEFASLYPDAPEESEFALLDLIHFGKQGLVETKITKFFQEGKNSFMFLGLLVRTYSKYVAMRSLIDSGTTIMQARESLSMKEWTFKKYMEVVGKKSLKRLFTDLEALLQADSKLKNRSLGETEIFSDLAARLSINSR